MRRLATFFLLAPLVTVAYACEDSETSSSTGGFDAGTGAFDAGPPPDGPLAPDGGPDASSPGVSVTVRRLTTPVADVRVLFHDATGAVTGEAKTDASGRAASPTTPAMLTVVHTTSLGTAMLTYLGLATGDALAAQIPEELPPERLPVGTYDVTFTGGAVANATSYEAYVNGNGCGGYAADLALPLSVQLFQECVKQNNIVYAAALDTGFVPLKFAFIKGRQAPPAGQAAAVQVNPWEDPVSLLVTATNIPVGATATSDLVVIADGDGYAIGNGTGTLEQGGVTYRHAPNFASAMQASVRAQSAAAETAFLKRAPLAASASFDFAAALPLLSEPTATPTATAGRPEVTLSSVAPLGVVDGGWLALQWTTTTDAGDLAGARWSFVLPPGTTKVTVPALPQDLAATAPPDALTIAAGFVESDKVPGYAELKVSPLPLMGPPPALDPRRTLQGDETVRTTTFGPLDGTGGG